MSDYWTRGKFSSGFRNTSIWYVASNLHVEYANATQFGGDSNHVTVGGASAGAASVELQLTAYGGRDDGLFHAVAAESQSFGAQLTVEESQYQYDALIQRVGCAKDKDTLQCLRNTDIAILTKNNSNIPTPGGAGSSPLFMWGPVIDGNFTTDYSYNLFSQGNFIKVPSIFGYVPLSSHHI
jgi:carboxylesterase type B